MSKKFIFFFLIVLLSTRSFANNMLIQNVTTTGNNATNKTIQVQFDMSWDNSWRDSINWDAAWIFIKFKDANGLWQHAQLNLAGYANGNGTSNIVKVTSDKVGAWVYRSALGSGTFNSTSMQLQWNYGLNGLSNVTGLEVRVFAVEMVYVPEGDFTCANSYCYKRYNLTPGFLNFSALNSGLPVINKRISPTLIYDDFSLKIKGDLGLDTNNDDIVDITTYPIGYNPFYCLKYEMTNQQYTDFLNTLTEEQIINVGVIGCSLINGSYFSTSPESSCYGSGDDETKFLSFADWSGLRPMTILEFNKASFGPFPPEYFQGVLCFNQTLPRFSYYGILDLETNLLEPVVNLNVTSFLQKNGNGILPSSGINDVESWNLPRPVTMPGDNFSSALISYIRPGNNVYFSFIGSTGFRYVRSAE